MNRHAHDFDPFTANEGDLYNVARQLIPFNRDANEAFRRARGNLAANIPRGYLFVAPSVIATFVDVVEQRLFGPLIRRNFSMDYAFQLMLWDYTEERVHGTRPIFHTVLDVWEWAVGQVLASEIIFGIVCVMSRWFVYFNGSIFHSEHRTW